MKKYLPLLIILLTGIKSLAQTMDAEQIYKKVNDAVVQIYAYDSYSKILSQGSGVVLNDKGWIVTNYHVYNGADKLIVRHNGKTIEYTSIIGVDADKDILILKIADHTFPFIEMGNSDQLNVGQRIYAIGSPKGFENTISEGIISGIRNYAEHTKNYIQISAPISHGSSGGAVVNGKGELIGISTLSVVEGQNLNFAIPVNDVLKVYKREGVTKDELTAADYFYKGDKFRESGNYQEAIAYYEKAIANYDKSFSTAPNISAAYNNMGLAKCGMEDWLAAVIDFNKAIELDPNNSEDYNNRGVAESKLKDYKTAIASFRKAIEINPAYANAYLGKGAAKAHLQDFYGAIADFDKAIEINPDYADAYFNRGTAKCDLRNIKGAISDFDRAIEINPKFAAAYCSRAIEKNELSDYQGAISDFDKAIEINPNDANSYMGRGLVRFFLGQKNGGCIDLNKAEELGNNEAHSLINKYCN